MTTGTPTITDFLLARIAEDEAEQFDLPPYTCKPGCCAPAGWVGHHCHICGTTDYGGTVKAMRECAVEHANDIHQRPRVLAQCKAHRAIVESVAPEEWSSDRRPVRWHAQALRALASIYAAHPGYRSEWAL